MSELILSNARIVLANEVLNGSVRGGLGNDTYRIDNAATDIIEDADQGTDAVEAQVSYTLRANFEHLRLLGVAGESVDSGGVVGGGGLLFRRHSLPASRSPSPSSSTATSSIMPHEQAASPRRRRLSAFAAQGNLTT